jgi:hypothetical protein
MKIRPSRPTSDGLKGPTFITAGVSPAGIQTCGDARPVETHSPCVSATMGDERGWARGGVETHRGASLRQTSQRGWASPRRDARPCVSATMGDGGWARGGVRRRSRILAGLCTRRSKTCGYETTFDGVKIQPSRPLSDGLEGRTFITVGLRPTGTKKK